MIRQRIVEGIGVPRSSSPLSQAVVADGPFVFVSGQVGRNPETGEVPDDFIEQARQALENLRGLLSIVGARPEDVIRVLVFVTDFSRGQEFNQIYGDFFGKEYPTRTRVQVAGLAPGYQIEIEAIAALRR